MLLKEIIRNISIICVINNNSFGLVLFYGIITYGLLVVRLGLYLFYGPYPLNEQSKIVIFKSIWANLWVSLNIFLIKVFFSNFYSIKQLVQRNMTWLLIHVFTMEIEDKYHGLIITHASYLINWSRLPRLLLICVSPLIKIYYFHDEKNVANLIWFDNIYLKVY